jgi:enoyl-CoA hydratase/carnithine racemase
LDASLRDPGVRVIVFASALEKFFSTGADLRVFQAMGPEIRAGASPQPLGFSLAGSTAGMTASRR